MAFRNLMLTTSGMILYAKAQQGKLLHLSRVGVGDGLLSGGDSMVNRSRLKSERASYLIDNIYINTSSSSAEILTTMRNDELEEGFYFRELGVFAVDPDSGEEQLYLYDNAGQDGEYIPAASENIKVIERLKMLVRLENTPNVTFTASGNPLYLTVDDIDDNAQSPRSLWSSFKISEFIKESGEGKQDVLKGKPGQLVGFSENGQAESQDIFKLIPITLAASDWMGDFAPFTQSLTVNGVLEDETKQGIWATPKSESLTPWNDAAILAVKQGPDSLTFQARRKPDLDIFGFVLVLKVGA